MADHFDANSSVAQSPEEPGSELEVGLCCTSVDVQQSGWPTPGLFVFCLRLADCACINLFIFLCVLVIPFYLSPRPLLI